MTLFWPLHLILIGIVLRGASFVFRAYGSTAAAAQRTWTRIFGIASAVTPLLLGACLGAISNGGIRGSRGWLAPFPLTTGLLALLISAYLAAVYLTLASSAAPKATLVLTAMTLPLGAAALIPSLWYLFRVFKGQNPAGEGQTPEH